MAKNVTFTTRELTTMLFAMLSVDKERLDKLYGLPSDESTKHMSIAMDKIFPVLKGEAVQVEDLKLYIQAENKKLFTEYRIGIEHAIDLLDDTGDEDVRGLLTVLGKLFGMDLLSKD